MLASMLLQRAQGDHGIPSAAISTLAPVRIGDLEPESRATGRVLHGFLAADALMIDGSVTDDMGAITAMVSGFPAIQGWIPGPTGPSRLTIPRTSRCSLSLARISSMDFKPSQECVSRGVGFAQAPSLRLVVPALERFRADQFIDQLFEKSQKLARQSRDSSSVAQEISNSFRPWSDSNSEIKAPELADYVGPVEVKMCEDKSTRRGRGLFATRKINRGEVVLVSNAIIFEQGENKSACDRDAAARLLEMAMKSSRVYKQLLSLVCEVAGDEREVPGMETFRLTWKTPEDWPIDSSGREALEGIEVKRTFEIVTKASYHSSSSRGFVYLDPAELHQPFLRSKRLQNGSWKGDLRCLTFTYRQRKSSKHVLDPPPPF
ncbi:hypothetical protein SELMODRAFT_417677 [Selaginella moellendorffii]|uniref:SET domain-containing protein n=1 Tax=Selaginella moellendorffii TaxID=88036 RepID=D8S379_SELML|nr:hypothetical protein SELMODRAFT_417677 [Selaginella moellendorffii]